MMIDWRLKLAALLHDPPEKVLGLAGHQKRAFELMERVLGTSEFLTQFGQAASSLTKTPFEASGIGSRVKEGDRIASAIDRAAFPVKVRLESVDFIPSAQARHPFCGEALLLQGVQANAVQVQHEIQAQTDQVLKFVQAQPDLRHKYLALWRVLPLLSPDAESRLLPPDTRIVDHTLWTHLDASVAVASALPRPAFLHVTIGPVQGFIAEARRTQDLWMGSYILSYLSWAAIRAVAEEYGPDAIMFPALRGQPLTDQWLKDELGGLPPGVQIGNLTIATLPNKFTALVPAEATQAGELPRQIRDAVRACWREIADAVKSDFPGGARGGEWERIWRRQVERDDWPEMYWAALPWPDVNQFPQDKGADEALRIVEQWLGQQPEYSAMLSVYKRAWREGAHAGTVYGPMHELVTAALDARKRTRGFRAGDEDGEKCTVSSGLAALRPDGVRSRKDLGRYWQEVASCLKQQGRAHELRPDGRERLSAIVAIKRFAQRSYFEPRGIHLAFPSTSRVAATPFYLDLFKQLPESAALRDALGKHLQALEQLGYPKISPKAAEGALPALTAECRSLSGEAQRLAENVLLYDADVLYEGRLDPELLEREEGLDKTAAHRAQATCRQLLEVAHRQASIAPPPTYYAVLMMDGDKMGKWLAGKHPEMPRLCDVFHPDAVSLFRADVLQNDARLMNRLQQEGIPLHDHVRDWHNVLNSPRPLSAGLHNSLSAALANFALQCVPLVIERRHHGRVVYAGGDDLLALLPMCEALPAARELRALFGGGGTVRGDKVEAYFGCGNGFLDLNGEPLLMPGPRITLSAGIAIAHHLQPLDAVLAEARRAEKAAKHEYGRNALCVTALKRSGEPVRVGAKWYYDGLDTVALMRQIVALFAQGLSPRFAYDVAAEALALVDLPDAQHASFARLLKRHTSALDRAVADRDGLAAALTRLARGLDEEALRETEADGRQRGAVETARWLLLARFIARGGGE